LRTSLLLNIHGRQILIDSGPDFRQQALQCGLQTLDGVIYTHAHHDHSAGLDELRIFNLRSHHPTPCLMSKHTLKELKTLFHYIFKNDDPYGTQQTTHIKVELFPSLQGSVNFQGLEVRYITYMQGSMEVNGLRFGNMAYITDIKEYSDAIFDELEGVEILILSALRFTPSKLHLSVDEAVDFAQRVGAKHTWLTHIAHDLDHEKVNSYLPLHIRMGYDGLELPFRA
jgi:phosphoribosyl 1,2-cyclic phosphate phosphodiesterase